MSGNSQIPGASLANVSLQGKTSRAVPVVLPAAVMVMGSLAPTELAITQQGSQFYVLAASAPVQIKGQSGAGTSAANLFSTGQGQKIKDGFEVLIIQNLNLFPITCLIWVGFDDFINDQLILVNSSYQQVAFATQPTPTGTNIPINDLSGQTFTDINGKKWGAISRVAILIFNLDASASYLVYKSGGATTGGAGVQAIGAVQPLQPIRLDFGGNYSMNVGGGTINALVSEIYNAFPV